MADNLIQIKRSQTTAVPAALANGELAFTAAGNVVFIGNFGQVLPIAGERTPGILTANQALVANSTGYINEIKASNVYVTGAINANGSIGSVGDVLTTDGSGKSYWTSAAALSVGPQYVANTDSRVLSGNLVFTGANTRIDNLNVGTINRNPTITLSGDVTGSGTLSNLGDVNISVTVNNANGVVLGVDTTGDYVADIYGGGGIAVTSGTGAGSTPVISANVDNSTIEVSGGALQVKDNGIALGTKTTGDYVASISAANGVTVTSGSGEGSTPTLSITVGSGLISNSSGIFLDAAAGQTFEAITVNGQATLNGNVVLGNAIQDRVTLNGSLYGDIIPTVNDTFNVGVTGAVYNAGYFTKLKLGSSSDSEITASSNTIQVHNLTVNSNIIANTGTVYHDFFIGGDLHISGNAVYSNVESYIVTDPLIQLAANNTDTDLLDIGFFGNYNNNGGGHEHTGFFRDASDGVYKLFDGLTVTPTTFVDTGDGSYHQATLQAYLNSGALTTNATSLDITGTSSIAVSIAANTLTLTTALAATSGGTGQSSYTTGDLLYASSSTALGKLSTGGAGFSGYVLQVNGSGIPAWDTLDGGTF